MVKNSWKELLSEEMEKDYFKELELFLEKEYREKQIYPDKEDIFNALNYTDYKDVKVLILGQDPYYRKGQANGFAFSVKEGVKIPPSLNNMYKELKDDLDIDIPNHGVLKKWADEGVLLLNASFTVEDGKPNSHSNKGWERFSDSIIKKLNKREEPVVFILWGNNAKDKKKFIDKDKHYIIESVHPSPLSAYRGFYGSKPYSKTNNFLESIGVNKIDWSIENL